MAGRFGRVYLGVTNGAAASPLPFVASWSLDASTPKIDVTSMGDTNVVNVAGLPSQSGSFGGFMDDTIATTYQAALDGLDRAFYLYPNLNVATTYFFGRVFVDASFSSAVDGAVEMSSDWAASTSVVKVPAS
jgi:hypothetical protein